jgi:hypothetical protein
MFGGLGVITETDNGADVRANVCSCRTLSPDWRVIINTYEYFLKFYKSIMEKFWLQDKNTTFAQFCAPLQFAPLAQVQFAIILLFAFDSFLKWSPLLLCSLAGLTFLDVETSRILFPGAHPCAYVRRYTDKTIRYNNTSAV